MLISTIDNAKTFAVHVAEDWLVEYVARDIRANIKDNTAAVVVTGHTVRVYGHEVAVNKLWEVAQKLV
jgi:hypothetical protein